MKKVLLYDIYISQTEESCVCVCVGGIVKHLFLSLVRQIWKQTAAGVCVTAHIG